MKNLLTVITLSMSALVATSAMADHDSRYDNNHRYNQSHWDHKNDHRWNNNNHPSYHANPSRNWRAGQYLPNQFNSSRYHVNYKNYRQLPKPGRYQQWYKVNGDYVLVNQRNHQIIRVIR